MSIQSEGRNVVLKGPENSSEGISLLASMHEGIGNVPQAVIKFKTVSEFTTFESEYSLTDNNVIVHFFMPKARYVTEKYWKEIFADALTDVAQEYFDATSPRLVAKYAEDDGAGGSLNSWWFKAQGFGHIIDIDAFVMKFFEKMDERLDPHLEANSRLKEQAGQ